MKHHPECKYPGRGPHDEICSCGKLKSRDLECVAQAAIAAVHRAEMWNVNDERLAACLEDLRAACLEARLFVSDVPQAERHTAKAQPEGAGACTCQTAFGHMCAFCEGSEAPAKAQTCLYCKSETLDAGSTVCASCADERGP